MIMLKSQRLNYCARAIPLKEKLQQFHRWKRFSPETEGSQNIQERNIQHFCISLLQIPARAFLPTPKRTMSRVN